jgi:hypothetical protein
LLGDRYLCGDRRELMLLNKRFQSSPHAGRADACHQAPAVMPKKVVFAGKTQTERSKGQRGR